MADSTYRAPKGTRDILWPDSARRRALIDQFAEVVGAAGYTEVVLPMFEHLEVFKRLGDATEVVRKEMYDFEDKGGRRVALRPEQTASVVRAFAQHRPALPWKAWYAGPNFRYERAQKGRFRQFDQVGVEALGPDDAHLDAEVIALAWRFYQALGLREVCLLVNSLGEPGDRAHYIEALGDYFTFHREALTEESLVTLEVNPLRVLDSKRDKDAEIVAAAPSILDYLSDEASAHFDRVRDALDALDIVYKVEPRLVRGLDYYVRTTFEFSSKALDASQDAVGGGGRYDGLAAAMGAPATPGVGFALGVDRTMLACDAEGVFNAPGDAIDVFVVDTTGGHEALGLTDLLRRSGVRVDRAWDDRSMKAQMKAADRSGAALAVIVGAEELQAGDVTVRDLRGDAGQSRVATQDLLGLLREQLQ